MTTTHTYHNSDVTAEVGDTWTRKFCAMAVGRGDARYEFNAETLDEAVQRVCFPWGEAGERYELVTVGTFISRTLDGGHGLHIKHFQIALDPEDHEVTKELTLLYSAGAWTQPVNEKITIRASA